MITHQFLVDLMPECAETIQPYIDPLNLVVKEFGLDRPIRAAAFISQIGHESVRFTVMSQIFNYSARGLVRVFPQFFTPEQSLVYAHNPLRIASRLYANKFGNGDEESGDGWRYRTRGFIPRMLGRSWYASCSHGLLGSTTTLLDNPHLLRDPELAVRAAAWFWVSNGCVALSDGMTSITIRQITKRVNGALHGLADRVELFNRALRIWNVPHTLAEDLGTATADGVAAGRT